jgi:hypothetical protein
MGKTKAFLWWLRLLFLFLQAPLGLCLLGLGFWPFTEGVYICFHTPIANMARGIVYAFVGAAVCYAGFRLFEQAMTDEGGEQP